MEPTVTWKEALNNINDSNDLISQIEHLDMQLKELHSSGYYAINLNFDNVYLNQDGLATFSRIDKIPSGYETECAKGNIDSLVNFALGSYLFFNLDEGGKIYGSDACDFCKTTIQYPGFVLNYYNTSLRSNIPDMDKYAPYYDDVLAGNYSYFSDYVKKIGSQTGKQSSSKLVKATVAGKGMTNDENDNAFVQILFYPIIGICLSIVSVVIYLLCVYL